MLSNVSCMKSRCGLGPALNPRGVVQGEYVREVLGRAVQPLAARAPHAIVIARERQSIAAAESRSEFDIELAVPAVSVSEEDLLRVRHSLGQTRAPRQLHASVHHSLLHASYLADGAV